MQRWKTCYDGCPRASSRPDTEYSAVWPWSGHRQRWPTLAMLSYYGMPSEQLQTFCGDFQTVRSFILVKHSIDPTTELDLSTRSLQYWWQDWQMLGLRKDILKLGMRPSYFELPLAFRSPQLASKLFIYAENTFKTMVSVEDAGNTAATVAAERTSKELLENIWTDRHNYIHSILINCTTVHPEANNRVLYFIETAALVAYSNQASIEVAEASRTVVQACAGNNASTRISQLAKNTIEADAQAVITEIRLRERIISTAGKAEKAVQCIAKAAASSVSFDPRIALVDPPGPRDDVYESGPETSPSDFWIRLCRVALRRYGYCSASLSTTAIVSFIVHLQDGGDEGGTAPLILKEDYDNSPFELGPSVSHSCSRSSPLISQYHSQASDVYTLLAMLCLSGVVDSRRLSQRRIA